MGLNLNGWNGSGVCNTCGCDGGIAKTALIDFCRIADVVIDANGCITNFVLNGGAFAVYNHDNSNDAAFYTQTGSRVNNLCHEVAQEAAGEYYCLNKDTNTEANNLSKCKDVVAVHELEAGINQVQGIETYEDPLNAGVYLWKKSKKPTQTIIDVDSQTTAGVAVVRLKVSGVSRCLSPVTSLTIDEIEAI